MLIKHFKIKSSSFLNLFGEKRLVNSVRVFLLSIKSVKLIQKYPHITESLACILKMYTLHLLLVVILFLVMDQLIYSEILPILSYQKPNYQRLYIFDNWVFDNLISVDELFAKALRRLENCLPVNNNT